MKNIFRRALLERQVKLGIWMQIGHPADAEVCTLAGIVQGGQAML